MDLQSNLIESKKHKEKGGWKSSVASVGLHGLLVGAVVFMTATASHKVDAEDKPIKAFMVSSGGAAPPPPPPPPPPPAASAATPRPTPVKVVKPVEVPKTSFVQPREIPKETPVVESLPTTNMQPVDPGPAEPSQPAGGEPGGVAGGVSGGVTGGVEGGVVGGTVGGEKGGEIGGVLGGTPGGVLGGTVGGTGSGTGNGTGNGSGDGNGDAKVEAPTGPVRVGGNVKAPVVTRRVQPEYTEIARKGRIQGVVIVEAIIDKNGNVDQVKVLRGLPGGLSEKAAEAVRQWKFRPGTMGGDPVDVIFNLVVHFTLDGKVVAVDSK